jgi:uncharacterized membrane protein YgcG
MPFTRNDDAAALEHILSELLGEPAATSPSPFRACFTEVGVIGASDFINSEIDDYANARFSVSSDAGVKTSLKAVQLHTLRALFLWWSQQSTTEMNAWNTLDAAGLFQWRLASKNSQVPAAPTPPTPISVPKPTSLTSDFVKTVKKNVSDYLVFKEDRLWQKWHRHLISMTRIHGLEHVLNPSYAPNTSDEVDLLLQQKYFLFHIFELKVQTGDGQNFVRDHSSTGDATQVYLSLVARYNNSTVANLSMMTIQTELVTIQLDSTWTKPILEFLNSWVTRVMDMDDVATKPADDSQKRIWLTHALSSHLPMTQSLSAFIASESLMYLIAGTPYKQVPFSNLFEHVRNDALKLDHEVLLTQTSNRRADELARANGNNQRSGGGRGGCGGTSQNGASQGGASQGGSNNAGRPTSACYPSPRVAQDESASA